METIIKEVRRSYTRALNAGDLIQKFYDRFLHSDPRLRPLFDKTNFDKQKGLLKQGIIFAIMHAKGNDSASAALIRLQESHGKGHMNIPVDLYPVWKEAFLATVEAMDPEFTIELRGQWDNVLQKTVDIVSGAKAV